MIRGPSSRDWPSFAIPPLCMRPRQLRAANARTGSRIDALRCSISDGRRTPITGPSLSTGDGDRRAARCLGLDRRRVGGPLGCPAEAKGASREACRRSDAGGRIDFRGQPYGAQRAGRELASRRCDGSSQREGTSEGTSSARNELTCGCAPGSRGVGSTGNNESIGRSADCQAACSGGGRCYPGGNSSVDGDHGWG